MRKLEGIVKEIVDEMDYLKAREERFQSTNSASRPSLACARTLTAPPVPPLQCRRTSACRTLRGSLFSLWLHWDFGRSSTYGRSSSGNISLIEMAAPVVPTTTNASRC